MKDQKPIWAINLRKARKQLGLTQDELAQKIFKSQETYGCYERGEVEPSIDTWKLLKRLFNISDLSRFWEEG